MFLGLLSDVAKQKAVLPAAIVAAIDFLQREDLANKAPGRYEIDGDKLFYMIDEPMPRLLENSKAESHQVYADIQMPISARERFGFSLPQHDLAIEEDFLESRDIAFFSHPENEFFMDVDHRNFDNVGRAALYRCIDRIAFGGTPNDLVAGVDVL